MHYVIMYISGTDPEKNIYIYSSRSHHYYDQIAHARALACAPIVLFPDPTLKEGPGTLEHFIGFAHILMTACTCANTIYANSHMIPELVKPRIVANVPTPFPCVHGGV